MSTEVTEGGGAAVVMTIDLEAVFPAREWIAGVATYRAGPATSPPLVLVHGWAADAVLNWHVALRDLARWSVVAPDLPGHGCTPSRGHFSLEHCAAAVAEVCDALGIRGATMVGYSMGGPVVQLVARDRPELVGGVVMAATAARVMPSALARHGLPLLAQSSRLGVEAMTVATKVLHPGSPLALHALATLHQSDKGALVHAAAELARFDSRPWIGTLGLRAASVVTTRDHVVPTGAQLELARLLDVPDERIARMAHGHLACLDHSFGVLVDNAAFSVT
jgi:pimeloyl-ACP methyl ester carboxylesterase